MPILDDLSGFEFEAVMEDVFRNLGYENVRQASKTADEDVFEITLIEFFEEFDQRSTAVVEAHERTRSDSR